jgi:4-alpha-glucanotransferase
VPDFRESAEAGAMTGAADFQARLQALREAPLVDHPAVCEVKLKVLRQLFASLSATDSRADDPRRRSFVAFALEEGDTLDRFAEFEALRLHRAKIGQSVIDWQSWPDEWRNPESAALARFRIECANQIAFQMYLQWEAARQLDGAAAAARAAGLDLVLYRDLAVGAAHDSAEAWGDQALIAQRINVGAPPDQFSRNGQNWGLPPWNPRVLAARAYRPFASLLAANMAGAGALRIDHVMALTRLFWIPDGMPGTQGAYVRQPFDALAAVVAKESRRNRCMVIGEDLGSVPDGLRERLHELGFLSYRVLFFERNWSADGSFRRPDEYPRQALATVATHDMPTIADWWRFGDIARRAALGLIADDEAREREVARRHDERWKVLAFLNELGLTPADPEDTAQITEALHSAVARTPSMLAIVQIDDVLGETEPANIPGTHREYPNWRRKLSRTLDEIAADPRLERLAAIMTGSGRGASIDRAHSRRPAPGS